MIDDLYAHDEWANSRILQLCDGLTDAQLDQPREMGFGTLRSTLFHILAAEEIWLERWEGVPWRPFPFDPAGTSLAAIAERLTSVAERRRSLIERERSSHWERQVTYLDSKKTEYVRKLADLLVHVANHGIHHRAQALSYLKQFGRTIPVGLDYLVFKFAYPSVPQEPATVAAMRQYGLEAEVAPGAQVEFNPAEIGRYFAYHDWANGLLIAAASGLDGSQLDRDFGIGPGSIRKTLLHVFAVEPWWMKNWATDLATQDQHDPAMPLDQLKQNWSNVAAERNAIINGLNADSAARIVKVQFGGPPLQFRVLESLIQICAHATHHRAQVVNMLRHSGIEPPGIDYSRWITPS